MGERGSDQTGQGQGQVEGRCERSKECVISGFLRHTDETCALLGGYAACSGNSLLKIVDNLSVHSSGVR